MKRSIGIIALYCLLTTLAPSRACPLCKEAVPNSNNTTANSDSDLPAGVNFSIYAMLAGVFTVAGVGGWKLFQVIKQSDRPV